MQVTKTQINAVLKGLGLGFVKMSTGGYGPACTDKCVTDYDNKRIKGIPAASHGPMTVTNVYREQTDATMREIKQALKRLGLCEHEGNRFLVKETSKSITYLTLREQWYPAYMRSANLDDGYKNIYIVPSYVVEKKNQL